MVQRRRSKKINVNVEWTINYDPTPLQQKKWSQFWSGLIAKVREKADHRKTPVEIQQLTKATGNTIARFKTTYRCSRCGRTWLEKRAPEGTKDPDWWKCPNGCYKKRT
jgi:DNA-directed RNA polymerase subunit RPC12/RpoP